ncbi:hypothetical protein CMO89_03700 [Candidatus Woesearchaeota archaeon]|nr:hypothetical protein [Candidatus Woesearchaeota archaeon]
MTTVLSFGAYYDKDWAWLTLGMIFLVVLINLFYAYLKISSGFITFGAASFFSSVGFFISMVSLRKKRFRSEEEIEIVQPPKIQPPKRVSKEFMPGKYVASQTGKRYHAPKCQWAKKINEDKAVWFDTEEEAEREGYEKDKCVA